MKQRAQRWSAADTPELHGRVAVVTGANSGLGFHTAAHLAAHGATLVFTTRSAEKGDRTARLIAERAPGSRAEHVALDLADLESVRRCAETIAERHDRIDILVANAGIMAPPRAETAQGHELQLGVNHLGHFLLTARLFPRIARADGFRIVVVTSFAAFFGRINFRDINSTRRYSRYRAYNQSKLANLLFALELDRRIRAADYGGKAVAAHPGLARSDLQKNTVASSGSFTERLVYGVVMPLFSQSAEAGALCPIRAATDPAIIGGQLIGPAGIGIAGRPVAVPLPMSAADPAVALRLWSVSEELVGERFRI